MIVKKNDCTMSDHLLPQSTRYLGIFYHVVGHIKNEKLETLIGGTLFVYRDLVCAIARSSSLSVEVKTGSDRFEMIKIEDSARLVSSLAGAGAGSSAG